MRLKMRMVHIGRPTDDPGDVTGGGRQMISAPVDRTTTFAELREQIIGEWELATPSSRPRLPDLLEAMDVCLPTAKNERTFDPTLPSNQDTVVWFVVIPATEMAH